MLRMLVVLLLVPALYVSLAGAADRPAVTFSVSMGGSGIAASGTTPALLDQATAIAGDAAGNLYVAGLTRSSDFRTTPGAAYTTKQADAGSFLMKLDAQVRVVYSTYAPGLIQGIALDKGGNVYLTGQSIEASGPAKVLVAEIDATGTRQIFRKTFGGSRADTGLKIGLDQFGYVYVAGNTTSPDFPATTTQIRVTCGKNCTHGFLAKLNPGTAQPMYATYVGGSGTDEIGGLSVDLSGNAFVAGTTTSPDLPVQMSSYQQKFNRGAASTLSDAFMARFNSNGQLIYSTYIGGADEDRAENIFVDGLDRVYITGSTKSQNFPVSAGAYQRTKGSGQRVSFVMKFEPDGLTLTFSTLFGADGETVARAIAIDANGDPVIGGWTTGTSLPTVLPLQFATSNDPAKTCAARVGNPLGGGVAPCTDAFLAKFDPAASQLLWSSYLGGPDNDSIESMVMGNDDNELIAGYGFTGVPVPGTKAGGGFAASVAPFGVQPLIPSNGIVNSAGFGTGVAPGGLASIFGVNVAQDAGITKAGSVPLPFDLNHVSAWFDGAPAPMLAVANVIGREQLNVQVPFEASAYGTTLIVKSKNAMGFAFNVGGKYTSPGIFVGGDAVAAAQHNKDFSYVSQTNPAKAGETIVFYTTGLGPVEKTVASGTAAVGVRTKEQVTVSIGGANAAVDFAGLSGYVGVYQLNVIVPKVTAGLKDVIVNVAGAWSNTAKVWVQ